MEGVYGWSCGRAFPECNGYRHLPPADWSQRCGGTFTVMFHGFSFTAITELFPTFIGFPLASAGSICYTLDSYRAS